MNRVSNILVGLVNFVLAVVEILLGLRIILRLLGASTASGFTNFVYSSTNSLVSPFRGIITTQPAFTSGVTVDWTAIIAMIVYALAAWLLIALFRWIDVGTDGYRADRTTIIER